MAFVFTITTTTSPQTFTIPCQNAGVFNATIDWGDGGPTSNITAYNDADLAHEFATAGTYQVTISGTFPNIYFNNSADALLLDSVDDLGDVGWINLSSSFYGCSNMTTFLAGTADTSSVTDMTQMFYGCSSLTSLDVSTFNTSSVLYMTQMFHGCWSLTSLNVSSFDTSSVVSMYQMFRGCSSLTSLDLSTFNTPSLVSVQYMFDSCSSLTSLNVSSFNTSSVANMEYMFYNCSSLTSLDVNNFNTSSVTSMRSMFRGCSSLTFLDVSNFDTSSVTSIREMFQGCSSLTSLEISSWNVSSLSNGIFFLANANNALTQAEYDATLLAWSQQDLQPGVNIHFGDANYTAPDITNYLFQDAAKTMAVTADQDPIGAFEPSDGSGDWGQSTANARPLYVNASGLKRFDGIDDFLENDLSGESGRSDWLAIVVVDSTDTDFALFSSSDGTAYVGRAVDASATVAVDANAGTPTYWINAEQGTPASEDAMHTALASGSQTVLAVRFDASNSAWDTAYMGRVGSTYFDGDAGLIYWGPWPGIQGFNKLQQRAENLYPATNLGYA